MTFLVMDTSGETCVLALADDAGAVLEAQLFEGKRTLSRRLLGEVDSLLTGRGLTLADLSALAVGLGPGSFTGVRVGITTVKTLAQVTGKPLVGIGTLAAYEAVWQTPGPGTAFVPVLPSRRGEVYAAMFRGGMCVEAPFAEGIDALTERLAGLNAVILGGDTRRLPGWAGSALTQLWTPPDGLARLAARRLAAGDTDDPLALVPLYVVAPSVSTPRQSPPAPSNGGGTSSEAGP